MSTEDFIASCLMVPTKFIDDLCDEYGVDFGDEEIYEFLNCCAGDCFHEHNYRNFGSMLVSHVLHEVVDLYTDVLDEDKFDYDISEPAIIYDGIYIENKQQLDEICNKAIEQQLEGV